MDHAYDAPATPVAGASLVCVLALHDRGRLPYASLHGEPMHVHAWRALVTASERLAVAPPVLLVDPHDRVAALADLALATGRAPDEVVVGDPATWRPPVAADVLVHDPLCPLTPADFLVELGATAPRVAAVGCRPVTDTVKTVEDDRIDATVDRDGLVAVAAPALVPAARHRGGALPTADMPTLLRWLREDGDVALPKAPSMARRVEDGSALVVLESIDELAGRVRTAPR